ncbi:uncharacterized protein [Mytilus edulis]|uniref:uncharacterized protein n=1 Tax=Mytilus edulis TaxID=6550 RepID=UPI0039EEF424
MSAKRTESLDFYDYLCRKIGSEKEVKGRRLTFLAIDNFNEGQMSSGSKSEGLDLKGSDIDVMFVDFRLKVYEFETEADKSHKSVLFMDTEDTHPCFTRLYLRNSSDSPNENYLNMLEPNGMKHQLSHELYKQFHFEFLKTRTYLKKIHGPCLSDKDDNLDVAMCFKCDNWLSDVVQWIYRPRYPWISDEIIYKITSSGVLFVPIGFKDSLRKDLEWRISFSVAEKFLIFSFNHTQLLCYALLKIVLKEIIEKEEDLKGLLCSYYLKTFIFWISDEIDPTFWRPDNTIDCFMSCLQRLLYCVEYSVLLHYFIPDFNFFDLRLSAELDTKKKLTSLLTNLYQQGIECFSASKTLHDFNNCSTKFDKPLNTNSRLIHDILKIPCSCQFISTEKSIPKLLNCMLYHSKTELCRAIFLYHLARAHQFYTSPYNQYKENNKKQYYKYTSDLSHLVIGVYSDAVVGWLMLASFFYVKKNYFTALDIIHYALSKLTDEKCDNLFSDKIQNKLIFSPKQESAIEMMKNQKLISTLKALTITQVQFESDSQIIPKELYQDIIGRKNKFHPLAFAHFLRFLCYYHLYDRVSCEDAMLQLTVVCKEIIKTGMIYDQVGYIHMKSSVFWAIAAHMMGKTNTANSFFKKLAKFDKKNLTSAAKRTRGLKMDQ